MLTFDALIDTQWMSWNPRIWVFFFVFLVLEPGFSKSLTKVLHLLSVTHSSHNWYRLCPVVTSICSTIGRLCCVVCLCVSLFDSSMVDRNCHSAVVMLELRFTRHLTRCSARCSLALLVCVPAGSDWLPCQPLTTVLPRLPRPRLPVPRLYTPSMVGSCIPIVMWSSTPHLTIINIVSIRELLQICVFFKDRG